MWNVKLVGQLDFLSAVDVVSLFSFSSFSFFLFFLLLFFSSPPAADCCGLALPRLRAGGHTLPGEAEQISFHLPTKYILISTQIHSHFHTNTSLFQHKSQNRDADEKRWLPLMMLQSPLGQNNIFSFTNQIHSLISTQIHLCFNTNLKIH